MVGSSGNTAPITASPTQSHPPETYRKHLSGSVVGLKSKSMGRSGSGYDCRVHDTGRERGHGGRESTRTSTVTSDRQLTRRIDGKRARIVPEGYTPTDCS